MRLRLIDRVRRYIRPRLAGPRSRGTAKAGPPASGTAVGSVSSVGAGRHRRTHQAAGGPATAALPDSRSGLSPASGLTGTPDSPGSCPRRPEAGGRGTGGGGQTGGGRGRRTVGSPRPARPPGRPSARTAGGARPALPRRRPRPPQPGTPGAEPPWAPRSGAAAARALGLSGQERVAIRPAPGAPAIQAPAAPAPGPGRRNGRHPRTEPRKRRRAGSRGTRWRISAGPPKGRPTAARWSGCCTGNRRPAWCHRRRWCWRSTGWPGCR